MAEHETNPDGQTGGLTRRKVLRAGAAAGAVAWAVPTAQLVGIGSANAQSGSAPPPPPPPPPSECQDISNIQIIVENDGTLYGLKWDDGFDKWSSAAPDANDCIRYYEEANPGATVIASGAVATIFNRSATVTVVSDCEWRLALPLPTGYAWVAGYIKFGNNTNLECPKSADPGATYISFSTT